MPVSGSVSALVPAYRHEAFVGAALDGVAAQTLRPFETVVIDDGSPDETARIVAAHELEGLRLLRQENAGAHAALNRAMREARGEWLAILNSDDVWEAEWIEAALGTAAATGAALVFGSVRWIDPAGRELPADDPRAAWYRQARTAAADASDLAAAIREHNAAVTTSNFFVHRALWEALGGFRSWRWVHDMDFLLRALALVPRRVRFASEVPAVRYRVHGANTISEDTDAALRERAEMLDSLTGELERSRPGVLATVRGWMGGDSAGDAAGAVEREVDAWQPRLHVPTTVSSPLRVGMLTPTLGAGGLEEVVAMQAEGLQAGGAEVFVRTAQGGAVADRIRALGIPVEIAAEGTPPEEWADRTRVDVVSSHFVPAGSVERIAAAGVPVVETLHNVFAWFRDAEWEDEVRRAAAVARVIAVSERVATYWARGVASAGGAPEGVRTHVVPNAVHPERLVGPSRALARKLLDLPEAATVFVHLGRISAQKDQASIATAFLEASHGADAILVLAGADSNDGMRARIERDHSEAIASGRLRLPGPLPARTLLSSADGFVMHSLFEGWSLAASEAVWRGLPVVLGASGSSTELSSWGGASVVDVPHPLGDALAIGPDDLTVDRTEGTDLHALTRGIERLIRGEVPAPDSAARGVLRERLDASELCRRTRAILEEVAGGRS